MEKLNKVTLQPELERELLRAKDVNQSNREIYEKLKSNYQNAQTEVQELRQQLIDAKGSSASVNFAKLLEELAQERQACELLKKEVDLKGTAPGPESVRPILQKLFNSLQRAK